MPGLVSTLLNQAYSTPSRLVQTFLQVTEQVWQPMHLSRFRTIPICALIFMLIPRFSSCALGGRRSRQRGFARCFLDLAWRSCRRRRSLRCLLSVGARFVARPFHPVHLVHLAHHHELV